jgi:transposase-like protein
MDRDSLGRLLDLDLSYEEIARRFGRHPSTISYWARRHGLESTFRDKHSPRGGLDRTAVERLIDQGSSIADMARGLDVSESTVQYWLRKWKLKTARGSRREITARGKQSGLATIVMSCAVHGDTVFFIEGRGSYRCLRCRAEAVARRRRRAKALLVVEAGGRCRICGYSRCMEALHFDHLNPEEKGFSIGSRGLTRSMAVLRAEAAKCVLLCANCHAEVEAGIVTVAAEDGLPDSGGSGLVIQS